MFNVEKDVDAEKYKVTENENHLGSGYSVGEVIKNKKDDHSEFQNVNTMKLKYKWYQVNTDAIPSKLSYFFECARRTGFNPNLILFFTSIGLNKAESGLILGLRLYPLDSTIQTNTIPEQFGTLFFAMFFISLWVSFAEGSSVALIDTATLRRSQLSTQRKLVYGRQRMFSAVGAAVGIFTANIAVDYFPHSTTTCYTGIFAVYAFYTLFYAFFALLLYRGLSFKENTSNQVKELKNMSSNGTHNSSCYIEHNQPDRDDEATMDKKKLHRILLQSLRKPEVVFLYLTTFISGLEYSQHTSFLYVYLQELDAPSSLLTLSIIFSNIASVFGFLFAQKIINLLGGSWRTIPVTFALYFVRYCGVGFIENPWLVLIFQPLHAVTATLYVTVGLTYLKETSPLPVITTLVSLFNTTHYGLGTIVGSSISGVIYEKYGGRTLFISTSILAIVWLFVTILFAFYKSRDDDRDSNSSKCISVGGSKERGQKNGAFELREPSNCEKP